MLKSTGRAATIEEGALKIDEKLRNGEALEKFKQMIINQGVNKSVASDLCNKKYDSVFIKKSLFTSLLKPSRSGK